MSETQNHDVIVVGGGPAGATVAALVAVAGRSVLLLDREAFPREHIGESLMPATYWILERLGVLDRMGKSPFPRKHSVQFYTSSGKASAPFYFRQIEDHDSSVSWQVDRARFDQLLLDNAREKGVEIWQPANVKDVTFDGDRASGITVELPDGTRERLTARVVVDCSGQTGLISRKLGLKNPDPILENASLYTRYRGAVRDCGIDEGATLILRTQSERTWFWYIPLPEDTVSVGVVGPIQTLLGKRGGDLQRMFDEDVARCPAISGRIANASQVMPVKAVRDFSYISHRIAGDGWVVAGDAFGFLDPIYSTGVFFAMKSAEMAADSILDAFEKDDVSAATLGQHGDRFVHGMESLRKLVYAYYDESFSIAAFARDNREHRDTLVHLLIGNVFRRPVAGLFESMGRSIELPEARTLTPLEEAR